MAVGYLRVLLVFLIAVTLGVFIHMYPGVVLIEIADYSIAGPLWLVVLGVVLAIFLLKLVFRLCLNVLSVPLGLKRLMSANRDRKIERTWSALLCAYLHEKPEAINKQLKALTKFGQQAVWCELLLAKLAYEDKRITEGDKWLARAQGQSDVPEQEAAFLMLMGEVETADAEVLPGLYEKLAAMQSTPAILALRLRLAKTLDDSALMLDVLLEMKTKKRLDETDYLAQARKPLSTLLASMSSLDALTAYWKTLDAVLKTDAACIKAYCMALTSLQAVDEAAKTLEKALKQDWQDIWVLVYASLPIEAPSQKLKKIESWLKRREPTALTEQALGQAYMDCEIFAQAKTHIKNSLRLSLSPQAYQLLAQLYAKQGKTKEALEASQSASAIST